MWSHVMFVTWLRTDQVHSTVRVSARVWFHSDSRYSYLQSTVTYARTVCLTSIDHPQIEGKFTATSGGLTNLFYGCVE